jgi:hypothetical protein
MKLVTPLCVQRSVVSEPSMGTAQMPRKCVLQRVSSSVHIEHGSAIERRRIIA